LAAVVLFALVACGDNENEADTGGGASSTPTVESGGTKDEAPKPDAPAEEATTRPNSGDVDFPKVDF